MADLLPTEEAPCQFGVEPTGRMLACPLLHGCQPGGSGRDLLPEHCLGLSLWLVVWTCLLRCSVGAYLVTTRYKECDNECV